MNRLKLFILFLLPGLLACRGSAFAQGPSFDVIGTGIAAETENRRALQDKYGFVWVGTESGIDCYDSNGRHLFDPVFGTLRPLEGMSVSALLENGEDIWIGGDKGLYVFDRLRNDVAKFANKTKYGVTVSSRVCELLQPSAGRIWLATQGQGLFFYDTETGILTQDSRHGSFYSDMEKGADGLIYAVLFDGSVQSFRQDGALARKYAMAENINDKNPSFIASSGTTLWVASGNRLFRLDPASGIIERVPTPGIRGTINTLLSRPDGSLLMSTDDGIWQYATVQGDFSEVTQKRLPGAPVDSRLASVAEGWGDNIILVHANAPLEVMATKPGAVSFIPVPEASMVRTFLPSADKKSIWIGSDNGLFAYDTESKTIGRRAGFEGVPVKALALRGNDLWVGTRGRGLYRIDTSTGQIHRYVYDENTPYSVVSNDINHIGVTKGGDVFILTNWGVCRYDPRSDNFPQLTEFDQNTRATLLHEDSAGKVWIETANYGLYSRPKGQPRFERDHSATEIPGITKGTVALGNGISAEGTYNGFKLLDHSKIKDSEHSMRAYASAISFPFLEDYSGEVESLGLASPLYTRGKIEVPFADNTFTLHFASVHPLADPEMKYDYMLRGIDKGWNTGASTPEATYNNLPPGEYEFMVRPHGLENATVSSLGIVVLPPWYRTVWAFLAYLAMILLLGWMTYHFIRIMVNRNFQRKMKAMQVEKERETFEAKTRYFVDLVHEIRTPLMLISMPLEQLAEEIGRKDPDGNNSHKYVKSMQTNVDYLLGITNQLLDFRRAESQSEVRLNRSRFDLPRLIRRICRRFEEPLRLSGKTLACRIPDGELWITGDADKLERVIMNLIGNAMKYAESLVSVTVDDSDPENVAVTVIDDGPGIPKEERGKIFDTYYQINTLKSVNLGTGLGLAYARLITEAHEGRLEVGDTPDGRGVSFSLRLPRKANGDSDSTQENLTGFVYDPDGREPEKKDITVLLVEDNEDLRAMLTDTLGKYYHVVSAPDGQVALRIMKEKPADVIVSDVMMERMDGMELCRLIKGDIEFSHVPFIILSALTTTEAHEKGLGCGADVYLEKPFPIRQLVMQIENLRRTRRLFHEKMRDTAGQSPTVTPAQSEDSRGETKPAQPQPGINRLDAEFIEKMDSIIASSLEDENFSIDVLAQKLNMSRSSFYRKITAVAGMSPNDYLKNFRLNKAAQLLRDGCRVTEVAEMVGFTSSSYFAKCFKAKFGVLPSEFS